MPFMGQSRSRGPAEGDATRPLSITEVAELIKGSLESEFADVTVEGAISGAKVWGTSGHLYFKLEDQGAVLDAAMWQREVRTLTFEPANGVTVRARGRITFFPKGGRLQMSVRSMEIAGGLGERERRLRDLRARLTEEGALHPNRKRPIPSLPRRIALVTSLEGAVIRDLLTIILRRFPPASILVVPVRVQGEGAAESIADGVRRAAAAAVDVMVVGRGGGSKEDLWAFNEEPVARALFASRVPVISAVGHETDHTLADDVADLRAATPSEAAERVVPEWSALNTTVKRFDLSLDLAMARHLADARAVLVGLAERPALTDPGRRLEDARQALDQLERRLVAALESQASRFELRLSGLQRVLMARRPSVAVAELRGRLRRNGEVLGSATERRLERERTRLDALHAKLGALNPTAVLDRGFSLTWIEVDGKRVLARDASAIPDGSPVQVTLARGPLLHLKVEGRSERNPADSSAPAAPRAPNRGSC